MKRIDMNKFAKAITLKEGGKVNLSIGQVKEVLKLTFQELGKYMPSEALEVIERYV